MPPILSNLLTKKKLRNGYVLLDDLCFSYLDLCMELPNRKKYSGSFVDHTYCCSSYGWVWPSALDWSAHERRPSCAPSHPECLASFRSIPIIRFIYSLWARKAGPGLAVLAPQPLGRPAELHISIVVVETKIITRTLFLYDSAPSKGT